MRRITFGAPPAVSETKATLPTNEMSKADDVGRIVCRSSPEPGSGSRELSTHG